MTVMSSQTRIFLVALWAVTVGAACSGLSGTANAVDLVSHKAVYDIRMTSAKTGSQVLDVRGKMLFMIKKTCDGWITDHKFSLNYEFAGSPPSQVESKFASFENRDGKSLNFSSGRMTNGETDQELRGVANLSPAGLGLAKYTLPDQLKFKLAEATLFPAAHTIKLIEAAQRKQKIVTATVFDGSDDKGPVDINAIIGRQTCTDTTNSLLGACGWSIRLAVFPKQSNDGQDISDYEMTMKLLDNGVVENMNVDYQNFSVSQKLVAIEPLKDEKCGAE